MPCPRHRLDNVPAGQGRTRVARPGPRRLLEQPISPPVTPAGLRPRLGLPAPQIHLGSPSPGQIQDPLLQPPGHTCH